MTMTPVGKADPNRTVGQLMQAAPRSGARYLDLRTGELLKKTKTAPNDLNDDGKVDDKDKRIAGRVLGTKNKK